MIQVIEVFIYIWKQPPVTSQVQFSQTTNNDEITPGFSLSMLIVSRFQPLTELFHVFDARESAR